MIIGIDLTIFGLQRVGGISTYAWELTRRVATDAGVSLVLHCPTTMEPARRAALGSLPAVRADDRWPTRIARYLPFLIGRRCDVVHSLYYRCPVGARVPLVVTVYDFVYERYRTGLPARVHSWQKSRAIARADLILCISNSTASDLVRYNPHVDRAKIAVVPLAVDHDVYYLSPDCDPTLSRHVVFLGRRGGYKRFDLAIAGVASTDLHLAIVGDPLDSGETVALNAALPDRWRYLGRLGAAGLRAALGGAFALVYCSDYEGFGLPILEAQACGCPVVAANTSSLPEVAGDTAVYADEQHAPAYAAALERLQVPVFRDDVIARGIANAASFDWDRTVAETVRHYRRLVEPCPAP